jgi:hypothetical protein
MKQAAEEAAVKKAAEDAAREVASAEAALQKVSYIIMVDLMRCNVKGSLRLLCI